MRAGRRPGSGWRRSCRPPATSSRKFPAALSFLPLLTPRATAALLEPRRESLHRRLADRDAAIATALADYQLPRVTMLETEYLRNGHRGRTAMDRRRPRRHQRRVDRLEQRGAQGGRPAVAEQLVARTLESSEAALRCGPGAGRSGEVRVPEAELVAAAVAVEADGTNRHCWCGPVLQSCWAAGGARARRATRMRRSVTDGLP